MPDLNSGIQYFKEKLGVAPVFGGYHKTQGTKNALLNLSDGCYLELINIDHENHEIKTNRWMGIDLLQAPKLIRWAVKSLDLRNDQAVLRKHDPEMGKIRPGSRQTASGQLLKWELIMPLSAPEVEVMPFMLDWSQSEAHPTQMLEPSGYSLQKIQLSHPEPERIAGILQELSIEVEIIAGDKPAINATLLGPGGIQII